MCILNVSQQSKSWENCNLSHKLPIFTKPEIWFLLLQDAINITLCWATCIFIYFKPRTFKNYYIGFVHWLRNFCGVSFVIQLHEDGNKRGQNM